jgi:hypothetical protein
MLYYNRTLETHEALFVSRCQQRIAVLGAELADEFTRNDVTNYKAELIVELEYAIKVLYSTDLVWTADEIQMMIDYYTVYAELTAFGFRAMVFNPTPLAVSCDCDTILTLITNLSNKVDANYDYLLNLILTIDTNWQEGDQAIYDYINNLTLGGDAIWSADATAEINVGGVRVADFYALGSPLEQTIRDLITEPPSIVDFTFDTWIDLVEIGDTLVVSQFTWTPSGSPQNIKISDDAGVLTDQAVTGVSYTPGAPLNYPFATGKTITWTIEADRMDPVTISVTSVYRTYFDKETTADDSAVTITEAKILAAATSNLQRTDVSASIAVATSNVEQGFIAVAKTQSQPDYLFWRVNDNNNSDIVVGEFIRPPVDIVVSGVTYSVYRWGYRSPLTDTLTLQRIKL